VTVEFRDEFLLERTIFKKETLCDQSAKFTVAESRRDQSAQQRLCRIRSRVVESGFGANKGRKVRHKMTEPVDGQTKVVGWHQSLLRRHHVSAAVIVEDFANASRLQGARSRRSKDIEFARAQSARNFVVLLGL
jgi:hypothetical protein